MVDSVQDCPISLVFICKNVEGGCLFNIVYCFTDFLISFSFRLYDGRNLFHHTFHLHTVGFRCKLLCALHLPSCS